MVVQQPEQAASAAARISLGHGKAASNAFEAMPTIGDDAGVSTAPPPRPARKSTSNRPAAPQLQLHGDACVLRTGLPPWPLRGRAAALVALAALEPGIHRERAAQMLWPDAPNPRQNLRQQLLRFRQALGQPLIDGEDHLQLAPGVVLNTQRAAQAELLIPVALFGNGWSASAAPIDRCSANPWPPHWPMPSRRAIWTQPWPTPGSCSRWTRVTRTITSR